MRELVFDGSVKTCKHMQFLSEIINQYNDNNDFSSDKNIVDILDAFHHLL